jgi:tripartite-type tricarboxylate transporter receptor subunit TctC
MRAGSAFMADRRMLLQGLVLVLPGGLATAQPVEGAAWPGRPVRIICPSPPGSSVDTLARGVAEGLARRWGQPAVVENRTGADAIPAFETFAHARPGEALFLSASGVITLGPLLRDRLPLDPSVDLAPISLLATDFLGVVVPAALPAADLPALLAVARARPGALNWFAAPGIPDLVFRAFLRETGAPMEHVPYRGAGAQVMLDVAAGRIQVALVPLTPAMPLVRDGRLRLLAVTSRNRAPAAPDVATTAEAGFPVLEVEGLLGLYGWRAMPGALRARIAAEASEALAAPELAERLRGLGMLPQGGPPADLAALLEGQRARYGGLAREFGVAPAAR